ncbi:MAG: nucleotide exchange factor GrpE [Kofleriaceae bacterium]|nr:nucleotide exchange factor GrpE [Kofleriaceae bacterium]MCL4222876.1 nucleotide exchange factor GrpE [Myxococcales bacterium]
MSQDADTPDPHAEASAGAATGADVPQAGAAADPAAAPDGAPDGLMIEVDASESPAARIAALEADVARLTQEKKELWDKVVRGAADLENFRKRSKRDLDDARHDARTRVLKEMLPVVDNLERAVAHSADADAAAILEGVRLVLRQFTHAFERTDVTAVEAEGQPFDPNVHEAIGQEESDAPPGTVVTVLQRGYRLGDKLLRPSLVIVARARTTAAPTGGGGAEGGGGDGGEAAAPAPAGPGGDEG